MNILLCSYVYHPSVGGIETASRMLAQEFTRLGHSVVVATETPGTGEYAYMVVRQPSFRMLRKLARKSDVILQNNISLKTLLPIISFRRRVVVATHTWIARTSGIQTWQDWLKLAILRTVKRVAISKAIADSLGAKTVLIPNCFEIQAFQRHITLEKDRDLVFMGRLVSDKGCDLLIRALVHLRVNRLTPSLTIVGDGPERSSLEKLIDALGLAEQVSFTGSLGDTRGATVARHKVMCIPSRWAEPFGLVALEGIACGCVIVGSSNGGLPEAIGECGLLFPNGDEVALADAITRALTDKALRATMLSKRKDHLAMFAPEQVAERYLELFEGLVGTKCASVSNEAS